MIDKAKLAQIIKCIYIIYLVQPNIYSNASIHNYFEGSFPTINIRSYIHTPVYDYKIIIWNDLLEYPAYISWLEYTYIHIHNWNYIL